MGLLAKHFADSSGFRAILNHFCDRCHVELRLKTLRDGPPQQWAAQLLALEQGKDVRKKTRQNTPQNVLESFKFTHLKENS